MANQPAWLQAFGLQRVLPELKSLHNLIAAGKLPQVTCLACPGDDALCWRFRLGNFDDASDAGDTLAWCLTGRPDKASCQLCKVESLLATPCRRAAQHGFADLRGSDPGASCAPDGGAF